MVDKDGNRRKLIIFPEPKDTVHYPLDKVRARIGRPGAVEVIHGGVTREERRKVVERFMQDRDLLVLIANDAAGEGVNLQRGHLMVNYDLPWNPNKIEQRFGRIHRIGQTEVCHLWNIVAAETREGEVYGRLLEKLEAAREALGGRVYDALGELVDGVALKDLVFELQHAYNKNEIRSIRISQYLARENMTSSATFKILDVREGEKLCEKFAAQLEAVTISFKLPSGRCNFTVTKKGSLRFSDDAPQDLIDYARAQLPRFHEAEVETAEIRDPVAAQRKRKK